MRHRHLRNLSRAGDDRRCRCPLEGGARWGAAQAGKRRRPDVPDATSLRLRPSGAVQYRISSHLSPAPRRGVIRHIQSLTRDVAHFEVELSAPMTFEAGQFVVVETAICWAARAYSDGQLLRRRRPVTLVMKRKPAGGFSNWLNEEQVDAEIEVFGPLGRAVFRPHEKKNIVCIAGGSGIAGMMSILEHAVSVDHFRDHEGQSFFRRPDACGRVLP